MEKNSQKNLLKMSGIIARYLFITFNFQQLILQKPKETKSTENGSVPLPTAQKGSPAVLKSLKPYTLEDEIQGRLNARNLCEKVRLCRYGHVTYCILQTKIKLLQKNPEHRIGVKNAYYSNAKEVQSHPFFQNISMKHLKAGHYYPPFQPDVGQFRSRNLRTYDLFSKKQFMLKTSLTSSNFQQSKVSLLEKKTRTFIRNSTRDVFR